MSGRIDWADFVCGSGIAERKKLNIDAFEQTYLTVARHIFMNFERPNAQRWMNAFMEAERAFPAPFGATIAHAISVAIHEMRMCRTNTFSYFNTDDPVAPVSVTKEERYFVSVLQDIRGGDTASAKLNALLLCEGGDAGAFLGAVERIAIITGDVKDPQLQTT
ncbi:MAG: hypothetical protein AAGJ34_02510 [Pseudomonadota bacterium]